MIGEICAEIKNFFSYDEDRHIGDFSITNSTISPSFDIPTDYIRIVGSRLNDGVHKKKNGAFTLVDEEFQGGIWVMSPPKAFLDLVDEITAWQEKNGGVDSVAMSPFNSESFGGYSYSKSGGGASGEGASNAWQTAFASRLRIYRRMLV